MSSELEPLLGEQRSQGLRPSHRNRARPARNRTAPEDRRGHGRIDEQACQPAIAESGDHTPRKRPGHLDGIRGCEAELGCTSHPSFLVVGETLIGHNRETPKSTHRDHPRWVWGQATIFQTPVKGLREKNMDFFVRVLLGGCHGGLPGGAP